MVTASETRTIWVAMIWKYKKLNKGEDALCCTQCTESSANGVQCIVHNVQRTVSVQ